MQQTRRSASAAVALASSVSAAMLLAGFLPTNAKAPATHVPNVTLNWYYPVPEVPADQALVQAAVDKITEAKLHVDLQLNPIPYGDYATKMQTIVASGTSGADIIWTSNWLFPYQANVFDGAFLPINRLLAQYGTAISKDIPSYILSSTKVDGKFYGVPNMQVAVSDPGFMVQTRFVKQDHFNIASVRHDETAIDPLLAYAKKNDPGYTPLLNGGKGAAPGSMMVPELYGYWPVSNGVVKMGTDHVLAGWNLDLQYLKMAYGWYRDGYTEKDAGTANVSDLEGTYDSGEFVSYFDSTEKPGGQVERQLSDGGYPVTYARMFNKPLFVAPYETTMNAISARSQHPKQAMMVLNLVNSDSTLFNLLAFGIKNRDYTMVGPDTIKIKPNGGYSIDVAWTFGDIFNGYRLQGQGPNLWKVTQEWNSSAHVSPFSGFTFNPTSVASEIANIDVVQARWQQPLFTGSINPTKYFPQYESQMKQAGIGKVLQALQVQLNAYVKANHINLAQGKIS